MDEFLKWALTAAAAGLISLLTWIVVALFGLKRDMVVIQNAVKKMIEEKKALPDIITMLNRRDDESHTVMQELLNLKAELKGWHDRQCEQCRQHADRLAVIEHWLKTSNGPEKKT